MCIHNVKKNKNFRLHLSMTSKTELAQVIYFYVYLKMKTFQMLDL